MHHLIVSNTTGMSQLKILYPAFNCNLVLIVLNH